MHFTDIFIRRPVLAIVVSLAFVVLGLRAATNLPINQYPQIVSATVTVTTAYPGADAQTVAGFITQPLEASIAQAQGIDTLSSSSSSGVSVITAHLRLNYPADSALTEISAQVSAVRSKLPPQAQAPSIAVSMGQTTDAMYIGFFSDVLKANDMTDFVNRVVVPQLNAVNGVQTAEVLGGQVFAMRIWLDPIRMAGHGVTAADVSAALAANNYLSALGATKGQMITIPVTADTDLHTVADFRKLVVSQQGGSIVRLGDVANVTLGAQNYDTSVAFGGVGSVFVGIKVAPNANILNVAAAVHAAFPAIQAQLPTGVSGKVVYDSTKFITSSIDEVVQTLVETLLIVAVVIFLFLGSFRAVAVPLIAMPLSLVGAVFFMQVLGYSINLLTLLAMVLAIGLVVDDAIIVVENVDRHIKEEGKSPWLAAILSARELGSPILAMTTVLVAVYVPIAFQGGLTGALFIEFAFTLAATVVVSAIVALTLSPMMCSRFFSATQRPSRFARAIDRVFDWVHGLYIRLLSSLLQTYSVLIVMAFILICALVAMFMMSQSELAPSEDQGLVVAQMQGPPTATLQQMQLYSHQVFEAAKSVPEYDQIFQINGYPSANSGIAGVVLKPYAERSRSASQVQADLQARWNKIAGAQVAAFQFPSLPGASGLPVQFVITTTRSFDALNEVVQKVMDKAKASGKFYFVNADLKIDRPQANLVVDADKVAALGLTKQQVAQALGAALGGGYVNYFTIDGRAFQVIPQVLQVDRLNPSDILNLHINTPAGSIKVATVAHFETSVGPSAIPHFQQLNSATISGVPGVSQGAALAYLSDTLSQVAPTGFSADYAGPSRQFMNESGGFVFTLAFAVIIVFLVLAAQFESFRDPVVILVSVPLALFGAVTFIFLGFATINIYTEVGIVTLMGLISKHGILIVQYANIARAEGKAKLEAIEYAAAVRLRPILMTTAAMVFGVVPLVLATGAGAAGRHAMGLVIFTGMSIGTLFTLFVVPAMYLLLAAEHDDKAERRAPEPDLAGGKLT